MSRFFYARVLVEINLLDDLPHSIDILLPNEDNFLSVSCVWNLAHFLQTLSSLGLHNNSLFKSLKHSSGGETKRSRYKHYYEQIKEISKIKHNWKKTSSTINQGGKGNHEHGDHMSTKVVVISKEDSNGNFINHSNGNKEESLHLNNTDDNQRQQNMKDQLI